jgi:hypothetical protein
MKKQVVYCDRCGIIFDPAPIEDKNPRKKLFTIELYGFGKEPIRRKTGSDLCGICHQKLDRLFSGIINEFYDEGEACAGN